MTFSISSIDNEYINETSDFVKENANKRMKSVTGLEWYRYQNIIIKKSVEEIIPIELLKLHYDGWFHIHKLADGGDLKPYCAGIDIIPLFERGLITGRFDSKPPKHLDSAIDIIINFSYLLALERTGAVGLFGFDIALAPFIKHDTFLTYLPHYKLESYIKQQLQRFIFNCNYPSRAGAQSPFINISFGFNNPYVLKRRVVYNGEYVGLYEDYLHESLLILRLLCQLYLEGDALGRPFTFPIPTIVWNSKTEKMIKGFEFDDLFWDVVRLRGSFYFMNGNIEDCFELFSFCCRVIANAKKIKLLHLPKGIWVLPPTIGSIGYVSINLPRLVAWALAVKHEEKYFWDKLYELILKADDVLMILRRRYENFAKMGLYPLSTTYLGKDFLKNYFNTIAIVGMAEAFSLLTCDKNYWVNGSPNECISWYKKLLTFINKILQELETKTNIMHNLEQSPAEYTTTRFAKIDWFNDNYEIREYIRNYLPIGMLYTSQITPPYCKWDIWTQLDVEAEVQKLFTGGVVKLIFDHVKRDREDVKKIINYAISKGCIYVAYTPTITHCKVCGFWDVGIFEKCPKCGSITEYWSRIVGYYTPTTSWNEGKVLEFKNRVGLIV